MAALFGWATLYAAPIMAGLAIVALILTGMMIWMVLRIRRMEKHYRQLTIGTDGGNLERILEDHIRQVHEASEHVQQSGCRCQPHGTGQLRSYPAPGIYAI